MFTAHPLIDGFPGKSATHGAFGWSSLWLLRDTEHVILVDTGPPAYAALIPALLARHGVTAADVTDVLLTHAHWDHLGNLTSFPAARVSIGDVELTWAAGQPPGAHYLSDLHTQELLRRERRADAPTVRLRDGGEALPGITAIQVPGHTPGHLAFLAATDRGPMILAGDAVKNVRELATARVDSSLDHDASGRSVDRLRSLMRDTGAVIAPGHDVLLRLEGERVERVSAGFAQITYFASPDEEAQDRSIG